jgi:lysozyme
VTTKDYADLRQQLIAHEGLRRRPYRCTAGKLTIGIGRNLEDRDLSMATIAQMFDEDISECESDLGGSFGWFAALDPVRQRALIDLRFNLGPTRLRTFKQMLAAMARGDWFEAAAELEDSKWATQVQPARVERLTRMLRTGRD